MKTRRLEYKLVKELHWEASHVLNGLPSGHKCGRIHGHSYKATVSLTCAKLDELGMAIDFDLISKIGKALDHQHLNDIVPGNPTAEVIATFIYESLNAILLQIDAQDDVTVNEVFVWETATCGAGIKMYEEEAAK